MIKVVIICILVGVHISQDCIGKTVKTFNFRFLNVFKLVVFHIKVNVTITTRLQNFASLLLIVLTINNMIILTTYVMNLNIS